MKKIVLVSISKEQICGNPLSNMSMNTLHLNSGSHSWKSDTKEKRDMMPEACDVSGLPLS